MVSIIMPAFNAAPWIGDAIGSALAQTWRDLEVIVVDDGSTDGTAAVVEAVRDPRVRLMRQENRGAAAARNAGWRASCGTHLQFLDADDLLGPDKVEAQMAALTRGPAGAVASCAWARFSGSPDRAVPRPEPVWAEADPLEWLVRSLSGEGMMQTGAWLVPRAVAEAAGPWDESLSLHDDGEFFARVLLGASKNLHVPGPLVRYRQVPTSLSQARGAVASRSAMRVCILTEELLLRREDSARVRRALATQLARYIYDFQVADPAGSEEAMDRLERLGFPPWPRFGGLLLRAAVRLLGTRRAFMLRRLWLGKRMPAESFGPTAPNAR